MSDFSHVEIGSGAVKYDGRDIGFLKDVTFISNIELEKLKTGNPLKLRGQKAKEYTAQLQAEMFEVSDIRNVSLLLGGGLVPTPVGGSPTTKTAQTPLHRCVPVRQPQGHRPGRAARVRGDHRQDRRYAVRAEHGDYLLDAVNGLAYVHPTGNLAAATSAKCTYTFTPPDGQELYLGSSYAISRKLLEFVHVNEDTLEVWKCKFWLASPDGKANFKWSDSGYVTSQITFRLHLRRGQPPRESVRRDLPGQGRLTTAHAWGGGR